MKKIKHSKLYKTTYKDFVIYAYKNDIDAWLGYVDVTDKFNFKTYYDTLLCEAPFHGGCTFCERITQLADYTFDNERLIVGCDWCHAGDEGFNFNTLLFGLSGMSSAVEETTIEEVEENLKGVVDYFLTELTHRNRETRNI